MTIPYLAWVLGPAGWGLIAFTQSFACYLTLPVEYGFNFSATREVSVHRHSDERRAEILAGVLGAKCLLAAGVTVAAAAVHSRIELFRLHPDVFAAGLLWGLAQAFNMTWYFLGLERMRLVACLDLGVRGLSMLAVFVVVRSPGDAWKVLAVQAAGSALSAAAALGIAWRRTPCRLPQWRWIRGALARGRGFLLFRAAETLYTSGNPLLLGLLVDPATVGYFAGAEKICRGLFVGLLDPVHRSLFPRIAYLIATGRERAIDLVRRGAAGVIALGLVLAAAAFLLAPRLVAVLLGTEFAPAVAALRILAVLPAAIAVKWAIGLQWMMPLGLEGAFNTIILGSAVFHLAAASVLARLKGHVGMAVAVAATELLIPIAVYVVLRARGLDPLFPQPCCATVSE
jgi:PST family polysaccharide transporter